KGLLSHVLVTTSSFQSALVMNMAEILLDNYCFPENLVGMQEAIEQAISSGEILHISDRKTLAAVLTAGVQGALNDPRLVVSYEPNYTPATPATLPYQSPEQLKSIIKSSIKVEVLQNNIGYLRMDHIIGKEIAEETGSLFLERVWNKVFQTSSLVLDLRYATTGDLSGIPYIVSFFSDAGMLTHIDTVYDRPSNTTTELWTMPSFLGERYGKRRDLIILTSKRTIGVAEGVAYLLKHLKRALVVGERSAGGSVRIEKLRIGEFDFYITVPVTRSLSPLTGQSWEVSGVSPCVDVSAKDALDEAKSLLVVRASFPKAVQGVSDIIRNFYSFTDKIPTLIQHLASTDFFSITSEEGLAAKLNYELQSIAEDPRLNIKVMLEPPVVIEEAQEPNHIPDDPSFLEALIDTVFKVNILSGNTGYVRFDEFIEAPILVKFGEQIFKNVWDPIRDTKNLIIDLRFNSGGPLTAVPVLLSYLHDSTPPVHFFTVYNRMDNITTEFHTLTALPGTTYGSQRGVYVLTSYHTATAGEEFAYLTQSLRRATVIGEITSGTLLHSKSFQVEDTNIVITVPIMNFIDNNGECWLGGGVVPDAIVLAEDAMEQAHRIIAFHEEVCNLVELAGDLLKVHYAIPEVAINVTRVLKSKWAEGSYRAVVDYESLASQLTADLQETSGDHRLNIFYCDTEPEVLQNLPKIPSPDEVQDIINTFFKLEILPENIGYLRVDMMPGTEVLKIIASQLVDLVWIKLVNTDTLVIDIRFNTGGSSSAIPFLCTYFFEPEPLRHLYSVFNRSTGTMTEVMTLPEVPGPRYSSQKDIYVLTSHMTGSAAEAFARAMKELGRATIVGEPTVGGTLSSGTYQIGDSILYASIPNNVVLSAVTGKVWSISGVEPHVAVDAEDALDAAVAIINLRAKIPAIIQAVGVLVEDNYAFADTGANASETLLGLLEKGHYSMIASQEELETQLSSDLKELFGDKCLAITHKPGKPPMATPRESQQFSFHTDVLENNIGYLCFDAFGDYEQVAPIAKVVVENVWNKVVDTDAMIIDLRNNLGGSTSAISGFCSYFFDGEKPLLLDTLYTRPTETTTEMWTLAQLTGKRYGQKKSIIILTSGATASAAEEFVYIMKKLGRAMIVGETTNGGCHPPEHFHLADGNMYLSIPVTHSDTTHGPAWEGAGISPHIPVPADAALDTAREILNKHLRGQK
uniref:Retinol binding protein 3 n=1 Tax=Scleropages formosus TaxID=113540 RepID=A0A8C9R997_SCLFO